jgi:Alcohol dehydrogenase, class IV
MLTNDMKLNETNNQNALIDVLEKWTLEMNLPQLDEYNMRSANITRVVTNYRDNNMKTNPLILTNEKVTTILRARL